MIIGKAVKIVAPCVWSLSDIDCMLEPAPALPSEPQDPVTPEVEEETVPPAHEKNRPGGNEEVVVPVSGPPRKWVNEHGFTPGCTACKTIQEKGQAMGRNHNKACKERYRDWLKEQLAKRRQEEEGDTGAEEPKRRRLTQKVPRPPGLFLLKSQEVKMEQTLVQKVLDWTLWFPLGIHLRFRCQLPQLDPVMTLLEMLTWMIVRQFLNPWMCQY